MNDKKIISEITDKNEKVFESVVDRYAKLLWKVAAGVLADSSPVWEVEECVADVFIYLWEHPEKYVPEKGKLSSWLAMLARSRAIDRLRRLSREREVLIESALAENEAAEPDDNELTERVRECVERLGDEEREIIIRRFYQGQKNPEIASAMKLKPKQVENRIYSAKNKLRKMMEEN